MEIELLRNGGHLNMNGFAKVLLYMVIISAVVEKYGALKFCNHFF
jgi:hypothetical protein